MLSRSGLGDEPLFPLELGGQYLLRIQLSMGNASSRLPLMVEGVSSLKLAMGRADPGTPLQASCP